MQQPHLLPMATDTDATSPSVRFSVSYSLSEYLSIVKEHLPVAISEYSRRKGKPPRKPGMLDGLLLVPFASVAFAYKKRKMPVCDFTISEQQGIERITALGRLHIPWEEVVAIHRYSRGYLVMKKEWRCPAPSSLFHGRECRALRGTGPEVAQSHFTRKRLTAGRAARTHSTVL